MSLTSLTVLVGICTFATLSSALPQSEKTISSGCVTEGGDDTGSSCVFPFIYKNQVYNGCTLAGADDGERWCSTKLDSQGVHVSGEGKWGHCGQGCPQDQGLSTPSTDITSTSTTKTTTTTTTMITEVLWIPEDSSSLTLSLPDLSPENSNCEITNPGVDGYKSQFQMIQGKLYACNRRECKRYNDEAKRWDSQAGMKFQNERIYAASTVIGDKWIVQGGKVYVNGKLINVPTTEEWTPGQPNWKVSTNNKYISTFPVSSQCLLTLQSDGDNKVMWIGGFSWAGHVTTNRCFIDGREVASMKRGRRLAGCSVFQGKVYVTGGHVTDGEYNSVEIYDQLKDQWTDGPTLPFTGRDDSPQLVEIKKELHYIGGHSSGKIWRLGNNRWEEVAQVEKSWKFSAAVVDTHCN